MNSKKLNLILTFILFISSSKLLAQKKLDKDTNAWRYEVECAGNGVQGTSLIKVYSYFKKPEVDIEQVKKNAVHAIIFQGFAGMNDGKTNCIGQKPLTNNPNLEEEQKEFFDKFFEDGGKYQKFASSSGVPDAGCVVKVGKEYRICLVVVVQKDLLRKDLEAAGKLSSL